MLFFTKLWQNHVAYLSESESEKCEQKKMNIKQIQPSISTSYGESCFWFQEEHLDVCFIHTTVAQQ